MRGKKTPAKLLLLNHDLTSCLQPPQGIRLEANNFVYGNGEVVLWSIRSDGAYTRLLKTQRAA